MLPYSSVSAPSPIVLSRKYHTQRKGSSMVCNKLCMPLRISCNMILLQPRHPKPSLHWLQQYKQHSNTRESSLTLPSHCSSFSYLILNEVSMIYNNGFHFHCISGVAELLLLLLWSLTCEIFQSDASCFPSNTSPTSSSINQNCTRLQVHHNIVAFKKSWGQLTRLYYESKQVANSVSRLYTLPPWGLNS